MIDLFFDDRGALQIIGEGAFRAIQELRNAVEDIADKIELEAIRRAPDGEDRDTGREQLKLREHAVERSDAEISRLRSFADPGDFRGEGVVADIRNEAPGFRSIRGAGGRFVKGKASEAPGTRIIPRRPFFRPERVIIRIVLNVPTNPPHAMWVHQGTGVYGPHESPIVSPKGGTMTFKINNKWFRRKSVLGQRPNPYLISAYDEINLSYVPIRLAQLEAQLRI